MTGITKVASITNFAANVASVAFQICLGVLLFFDSSITWMPRASAMATGRIPPITIARECALECRPTIRPRVVITPDVDPKLIPVSRMISFRFIGPISE